MLFETDDMVCTAEIVSMKREWILPIDRIASWVQDLGEVDALAVAYHAGTSFSSYCFSQNLSRSKRGVVACRNGNFGSHHDVSSSSG